MTGTDPAITAARRAWDDADYGHGFPHATEADLMVDAARTALAPIRARHQPRTQCGGDPWCVHCGLVWPCPDARDSYTSKELNHD